MIEEADNLQLDDLVDTIRVAVRGGESIDRAARRLRRFGVPRELAEAASETFVRQLGMVRELRDPLALVEREYRTGGWYDGPRPGDRFWWPLRERLSSALDEGDLASVDAASDRIVSLLRAPGHGEIRTRGLVLGHVQSGKTTSFMSVIAKAADAGYRLIIVLSGITDSLRAQTQRRLDEILVGGDPTWHGLTYQNVDFSEPPRNAAGLLRDPHKRLLAVVKKNPARLRRLVRFIEAAGESVLRECPILVIDDEADQASIDVGQGGRQSRINSLIRRLLRQPKVAYLAYTATPFANLLVYPANFDDIYPRDFIVSLDPPRRYFGPERIFGRDLLAAEEPGVEIDDGLDIIRHVPPDDVPVVRPPAARGAVDGWSPSVPQSLMAAVRWFIVATTARRVREAGSAHTTMLVHTSMLTAGHQMLAGVVGEYLDNVKQAVMRGDRTALQQLQEVWETETARLPAESMDEDPVAWTEICLYLRDVVSETRIVVDNSQSVDRLAYEPGDKRPIIAIGGNTLSRGLTLEGLLCSYFVRSSNAYDTLLQMGRWFGYRPGYADLVRVWMTEELESWFFDLATVEEEIRQEIRRYHSEERRPDELPVRIRTHPAMMITAAAKMRRAVPAHVSYSETKQQTILFNHRDGDWLRHNMQAVRSLMDVLADVGLQADDRTNDGRYIVRNVPVDILFTFLKEYRFHEESFRLRADLLERYIQRENDLGALRNWSVVVVGDSKGNKGTLKIGGGVTVNRIHRSRLDMPNIDHANIKTLVSRIDRVADLDMSKAEAAAAAGNDNDKRLLALREDLLGPVGLLCLYPIAADSVPLHPDRAPQLGRRRRIPLDAVEDVVGVGLFFPTARSTEPVSYMSADLSAMAAGPSDDEVAVTYDEQDERLAREQEASQGSAGGGR